MRRFSQTGIQDFLTLTLTEQTGLLYVGAREALFAFSVEALELQGAVRGGKMGVVGSGRHTGVMRVAGPKGALLDQAVPSTLLPLCCSPLWKSCSVSRSTLLAEWACCFPPPAALGRVGASVLFFCPKEWGLCVLTWCPHVAATGHACGICSVCTWDVDVPPPLPRSRGRHQLRRRPSVSRKGRVTR